MAEKRRASTVHGAHNFARILLMRVPDKGNHSHRIDVYENLQSLYAVERPVFYPPKQRSERPELPEEPEPPACCFVCFDAEGPMLVNTCACRWSRIHQACLERMLETGNQDCGVCKTRIKHKRSVKQTLIEQVWKANLIATTFFTVGTVLLLCFGLFLTFDGIIATDASDVDRTITVLSFGVVIYAMVMLLVVFSRGWPTACPCRPPGIGLITSVCSNENVRILLVNCTIIAWVALLLFVTLWVTHPHHAESPSGNQPQVDSPPAAVVSAGRM